MLGRHIGGNRAGPAEQSLVIAVEARIEAFGDQVGVGYGVAGADGPDGVADALGDGMGKRSGFRVGGDDETVHG